MRHRAPVAYTEKAGRRAVVNVKFHLWTTSEVGFKMGHYDQTRVLTIGLQIGV